MFKNVIVGVDGRSGGRDAATLGRRLLDPRGRLTLVHVHLETTAVVVHEFDSSAREEARRLLRDEREAAGGEAELGEIGGTSVAVGLHQYAEEHDADLLVVGSSHRGFVGRMLAGDDTRSSLQCAPCAVAVSPPGYADSTRPIEIIGVGYDDSAESVGALAAAAELAGAADAEIHALILVAKVRFDGSLTPMNSVLGTDPRLTGMAHQLSRLERVRVRPAYGLPVEELRAFGSEVDLLLLGSAGRQPDGRMVLDRTSKSLARSLACPLLILPSASIDASSANGHSDSASVASF
jgi:nucleotide-binding universal stress UspA family protein